MKVLFNYCNALYVYDYDRYRFHLHVAY